jgi:hypothetical protein
MAVQPFQIEVQQPVLEDVQDRLAKTRVTTGMAGAGWDYGT